MTKPKGAAAVAAAKEHMEGGGVPDAPKAAYELAGADFSNYRRAIERDDADEAGMGAHVAAFWKDVGRAHLFDPTTVGAISKPDVEPITFEAVPVDEPEAPAAEAAPANDDGPQDWNPEAEHNAATERMERMASDFELDAGSLVSDARDFMLEQIKHRPRVWSATSQGEQRDVAAACDHAARELIRKMLEQIATRDVQPIRALLTKYTDGDEIVITAKVKAFTEEESAAAVIGLHKARGKHVMITVASVSDYDGNKRDPATDPDEPLMSFEAGEIDEDD